MELIIRIRCDNAAFGETVAERNMEINDVLDTAKRQIAAGFTGGFLRDTNGNAVGMFNFEEE